MASNKITVELDESDRRLINRLCDNLEGNQAKPESGTTACSDAGGVDKQVKTAGSAGRVPGLAEVIDYANERLNSISSMHIGDYHPARLDELNMLLQWIDDRANEARRRDAGGVEPPAG